MGPCKRKKKAEVNVRGSELTGNPQEREVSECRVSLYCHKQSGPDQMEADGGVFSKHRLQ